MTRVKSLKYQVDGAGHGYIHRTHRSKKKRYVLNQKESKSARLKELLRADGKIL